MASINKKPNSPQITTHEGGRADHISAEQQLRRTLLTCLLWEDSFYEDGIAVADRIADLAGKVSHETIAAMAVEARTQFKLRHAPLMLLLGGIKAGFGGKVAAEAIKNTIGRPDEMSELISLYWKDGRKPLPNSIRKGIAAAFSKFNEYELSKWDKNSASISLRDVMFLTHPKPIDASQEVLFKKLADNGLETADTWESNLSAGKDKNETFTRLLTENKLGGLALLRNLRNMTEANVDEQLVRNAIEKMKTERILPFRFTAARKYAPKQMYDVLEKKFLEATTSAVPEKLKGRTNILIDVSGSMNWEISGKSDLCCIDVAATVAAFCREVCENVRIFKFDESVEEIENCHGFALIDKFQAHGGTYLGEAVKKMNNVGYDRLIVITDEQSHDDVPQPKTNRSYMINVGHYQNGVGYRGNWTHISGWSEQILNFIVETEKMQETTSNS